MKQEMPKFPEPVPELTQLLSMTFVSAVTGYLTTHKAKSPFRMTLHRSVERAGIGWLQQISPYAERLCGASNEYRTEIRTHGEGRFFPVDSGIMGMAYQTKAIWRTRFYKDHALLEEELIAARTRLREAPSLVNAPARSWFAIPFVTKTGPVALVLFGESNEQNFFADDALVNSVIGMSIGFAALIDSLEMTPLRRTRNFPIMQAEPAEGGVGSYKEVHEQLVQKAPQLAIASSFNFEATTI